MSLLRSMLAGAVVWAGFAIVVLACSSDGDRSPTVFPSQSSTSSGSAGTSSSGGASSSSGSPGDGAASSSSGSTGDGSTGDAGTCAPLPAQIDMVSVATEPTETGGTVVDGTYVLTNAEVQDDQADGGPIGKKKAAVFVFSGNKLTWHYDREIYFGMEKTECCEGTFSVINGNELNMGMKCNGTNNLTVVGYTVLSPTQLRIQYGGEIDTFTKQ